MSQFGESPRAGDQPGDDLGLTREDWADLQFAYIYGTLEPLEGTVEDEAFARMAAYDREEAGRRAQREALADARRRYRDQPFPGGPLTARLTSREAAELSGRLLRGWQAARDALRDTGYGAPGYASVEQTAREITEAHSDVHAEVVIAEDGRARARQRSAGQPFPGGPVTAGLTSGEAAELIGRLSRGSEAAWRAADEAAEWDHRTPQWQTAAEVQDVYLDVEAEAIVSGIRWPGEALTAFSGSTGHEPARISEPRVFDRTGRAGTEARAEFEAEP